MLVRLKKMLGIEDASQDEFLLYLIDSAIGQITEYTHNSNIEGLDWLICQLCAYNYKSGEAEGSAGSSGVPVVGEIKKEAYSGVTFEYTTSADFVGKSSSSSSSGEGTTYFSTMIVPYLRSRRKMRTF